jgi:mRNA-degrading endonuclease RelE of RelBE toxin-antitoxin system
VSWQIEIARDARKELERLPTQIQIRVSKPFSRWKKILFHTAARN